MEIIKTAKTDDVLIKLGKEYTACLEKVLPINYNHKTYRLINIFSTLQYMKCDICGNCPIPEIFIIRSEEAKRMNIGNICIDRLTNQKVSKWFRNYRKKRENIIKNSRKIDNLSSLLNICKKRELPCNLPFGEVEKLRAVLDQMCKGLNLNWQQEQLAENYLGGKKRLCD